MSDENRPCSAESRGYEDVELTETIIACVIKVHQALGPGFIEKIYQNAMAFELAQRGISFEVEKRIMIYYAGHPMGLHRLDMLVADRVILETKAVNDFCAYDYARLRSYLKAAGCRVGLLVNFNKEKADFRRVEFKDDGGNRSKNLDVDIEYRDDSDDPEWLADDGRG